MRFKVSGTVVANDEPVTFMVNAPSEPEAHTLAEQRGIKVVHVSAVTEDAEPLKIATSQIEEGDDHPPRFDVAVEYEYEGDDLGKPSTIKYMGIAGIGIACIALAFLAAQFPRLLHAAPPTSSVERKIYFFSLANSAALIALHLVLLGSAIGCLLLRRWAHAGMIGYALLCLFLFVFQLGALRMYTVPFEAARLATMSLPLPPRFQTLQLLQMIPWQILPIAILLSLRGRAVRHAFGIKEADLPTIDD